MAENFVRLEFFSTFAADLVTGELKNDPVKGNQVRDLSCSCSCNPFVGINTKVTAKGEHKAKESGKTLIQWKARRPATSENDNLLPGFGDVDL